MRTFTNVAYNIYFLFRNKKLKTALDLQNVFLLKCAKTSERKDIEPGKNVISRKGLNSRSHRGRKNDHCRKRNVIIG